MVVIQKNQAIINAIVGLIIFITVLSFALSIDYLREKSFGDFIDDMLAIVSFIIYYLALSTDQQQSHQVYLENIFRINHLMCAIFMLFAFAPFDFKYDIVNEYGRKQFTMGLGNPNATALCIMFVIVLLLIEYDTIFNPIRKIAHLIITLSMFYILLLLRSRTVLICAIVFFISFLLRRKPKTFKWISYFIVLTPILVMVFQLYLFQLGVFELRFLDKAVLTGRPEIYIRAFESVQNSIMVAAFGNLCKDAFYNYHNGILTIGISLGIFGVLLYILFWNQQLRILRERCKEKKQLIAFFAIIVILLHASSESMGVVGTIPYSVFIVAIMRIAKGEIRSKYDRFTEN